jgi:hypothetical protein
MTKDLLLLMAFFLATPTPTNAQPAKPPLSLAQTISLPQVTGGMNHFAADAKRGRFFFTATTDKTLFVIDLDSGKVISTITGYSPAATRFAPDLDVLCVSGAKAVTFYDGDSYHELGRVELNSSVDEMQYDPKTHRLYAGLQDRAAPGIAVIDVSDRKLLTKIKLPSPPQGFVIDGAGAKLYANTPGAKQVTIVDCQNQAVLSEWKLSEAVSNFPAALDEKNHRLLIGCRKPSRMLAIDIDSGKTVASAEIGEDTDDMSFDPVARCAYLACGSGVISVIQQIDADQYRALPNIPTGDGARNSLFIAERKGFYVGVPKQKDTPTQLRCYGE